MEENDKKLAKKVPKEIIKAMCKDKMILISFDDLDEISDLFCVYITTKYELVLCQITPDILNEQGKVICTGDKQTLITLSGGRDISKFYQNPIWEQSEWITKAHILGTRQKTTSN